MFENDGISSELLFHFHVCLKISLNISLFSLLWTEFFGRIHTDPLLTPGTRKCKQYVKKQVTSTKVTSLNIEFPNAVNSLLHNSITVDEL